MSFKKISIASDHAGFEYKEKIKNYLKSKNIEVKDYGTDSLESVDYPDFVHPLCYGINKGDCGILVCGSANGVAMTANKHNDIRAAVCWSEEISKLSRLHNDSNVVCIPSRFVDFTEVEKIMDSFLTTDFEGGRHQIRVSKI